MVRRCRWLASAGVVFSHAIFRFGVLTLYCLHIPFCVSTAFCIDNDNPGNRSQHPAGTDFSVSAKGFKSLCIGSGKGIGIGGC